MMTRGEKWDYALGLIKIDGLQPTKEYLDLVEKEKKGEITLEEIRIALDKKYRIKDEGNNE